MPPAPTLADHPVLDFINTLQRHEGALVDALDSPREVLRWVRLFGGTAPSSSTSSESLLASARELRETIRRALTARKAGLPLALRNFNTALAQGSSRLTLIESSNGSLLLERRWLGNTPPQLLAPIAEAAAHLLAEEPLDLIRPCESDDCILWFYDRTRSHRRRWCSMATCGNRHKVAAFRSRARAASAPGRG